MQLSAESKSPAKIFARSTRGVIWEGPNQKAALGHLAGPAPLKVLLGPPSSGKSTLLHQFQQQVQDAVMLPLVGPSKTAAHVLSSLLGAAGLGPWSLSEVDQRNLLTVFCQQRSMQGLRIVLCVDNIGRFSEPAWSEIERLRTLKYQTKAVIELAVVGTEVEASRFPLYDVLQDGATSAVEATHYLSAPSDEEVKSYIDWRFAQVGIENPFSADVCSVINELTQGRMNFINILSQVVLVEQQRGSVEIIDTAMVRSAADSLASMRNNTQTGDTIKIRHLGAAPERAAGCLVVSRDGKVLSRFDLNGRVLIGRDPDNDLFLRSREVSRYHAAIMPTAEGHYYVVDFNSANGVHVNGDRTERCLLEDGDVLRIGQFELKLELVDVPIAVPPPRDTVSTSDTDVHRILPLDTPTISLVKR
jgi:GTPase SAR1 family protein